MSRREWIALADEADLNTIVPVRPSGNKKWKAVLVSCGPKYYAERIMRRVAKEHGAKLIKVYRDREIVSPVTHEMNWLYVATFETTYDASQ